MQMTRPHQFSPPDVHLNPHPDLSQPAAAAPPHKPRGIVVFSGGSAANSIVDVFAAVADQQRCNLHYVIPISDNGGSSSELIRVFGGPGMTLSSVSVVRDQVPRLATCIKGAFLFVSYTVLMTT